MQSIAEQVRQKLIHSIRTAVETAVSRGELAVSQLPEITLEIPPKKEFGDYATNIAMLLTKQARQAPRQIAATIVKHIDRAAAGIKEITIAGPGFINFFIDHTWLYDVLRAIRAQDTAYGRTDAGKGQKVQVEFVSANPTGPLHMGNARGGATGSVLANLLDAAGYDVTREFYINDAGNQIENFGKSLEVRYLQLLGREAEMPADGYHGKDIIASMERLIQIEGDKYLNVPAAERRAALTKFALQEKLDAIKRDLAAFGVTYDVWFSEQSLHDSGKVQEVVETLRQRGYIYEKEGALWFKASAFGEAKDEVVVRANGIPTYYAADIAYHLNKFERGFTWLINIWGADHHGHVARMKSAIQALGYNPDQLDVIIMQLVRLIKEGEVVRMSKRSGEMITLRDLVEEVGRDAARFFFVMRNTDSHLDFDLDLAKTQSAENPVYYVQYAHARICSILRQAEENGIVIPETDQVDLSLLKEESELTLIRKLADLPDEIVRSAQKLEPHHMARYAHELAGLFHAFYNSCRVLGDDGAITAARLVLVDATRIVLRNVLNLLGITAPEKM